MISIKELSKNYGDVQAVDKITLEIPEGQIMGLLGPNGAGKSTTLRVLTGYLQPSAGTIVVDGHDVRSKSLEARTIIGYLPESSPLYPDMIVYDYLDYIASVRNISKDSRLARLKELAQLCGIKTVMHKNIASLSKGFRQRVGLALAMMSDPKILVLDEPTSGLDPNQIREIRSIIKEIGKEKTVIFSTHILSEAEATCDRVVIINQGSVVADGSMEELSAGAKQVGNLQLTLKGASEKDAVDSLSSLAPVESVECSSRGSELDLKLFGAGDLRETVYQSIKKSPWTLLDFRQEQQSLEDIFKELTLGGKSDEA
ncbi:MAG: ATP-binding cassette domain-containing protein [Spirochaetaceae bacterium]|jgi:ABC-2 type transport system ATP-binding protein|nr:ATP-binding cassette domain-containing protein [Spirochaetaceae bacterium]